jgi:rubredoxin
LLCAVRAAWNSVPAPARHGTAGYNEGSMESTSASVPGAPDWERIDEDIRCPLCEYDLRMLTTPRCPECGYRFAWAELLDPARRMHPYLFEHHPEANLRSFRRTLLNGLRPRRFWKSLHPAQPSSARRLIRYWCVVALIYTVPIAAELTAEIMGTLGALRANRASMVALYNTPRGKDVLGPEVKRFGAVKAYLDYYWPIPNSPTTLWQHVNYTRIPAETIAYLFFPLLYVWLTFLSLLSFGFSMRRARIRRVHVLRCVAYSTDVWAGLCVLLGAVISRLYLGTAVIGGWVSKGCLAFAVAMAAASIYRLYVAYRYYLRFDHPLATVLVSQVIVYLVGANLIAPQLL